MFAKAKPHLHSEKSKFASLSNLLQQLGRVKSIKHPRYQKSN